MSLILVILLMMLLLITVLLLLSYYVILKESIQLNLNKIEIYKKIIFVPFKICIITFVSEL